MAKGREAGRDAVVAQAHTLLSDAASGARAWEHAWAVAKRDCVQGLDWRRRSGAMQRARRGLKSAVRGVRVSDVSVDLKKLGYGPRTHET